MTVLRIADFGGEFPMTPALRLPATAAQRAQNLFAAITEFRPLAWDTVATTVAPGSRTIYRLARSSGGFNTDMSTGWIVQPGLAHYVKGPINDEATERTYYTTDNSAPMVTDVSGATRMLGVPKPTTNPTVAVTAVQTYTLDDKDKDIQAGTTKIRDIIAANRVAGWVGAPVTAAGVDNSFLLPSASRSMAARTYLLDPAGGIADAYTSLPGPQYAWVMDPTVGGYEKNGRWVVQYAAYAETYGFNVAAITAALAALKRPSAAQGAENAALLSADQVEYLRWGLTQIAADGEKAQELFTKHAQARGDVERFLAAQDQVSLADAVRAFYARPEVDQAIQAAVQAFATTIFNMASSVATVTNPYEVPAG